jgi:hypothetical protein
MQDEMDFQLPIIDPHESWVVKALLKEVDLTSDDGKFPLLLDLSLTVSATPRSGESDAYSRRGQQSAKRVHHR